MKFATKSRHGTLYLAAPLKLQPLAHSVRLAVFRMAAVALALGTLAASTAALAQTAQASPASKRYNIPAGSLEAALTSFAKTSGVLLVYPPALVEGLNSPGLQGEFGINDGVARILQGSNLEIVNNGSGKYTLKKQTTPDSGLLPAVTVLAVNESYTQSLQGEGKAADGYRTRSVSSMGALGNMDLLDSPFSVNVVSQELIKNIQAQSPDDVYKISPSTLSQTPQGSGWAPMVKIRGFGSYDRAEDGLRRSYGFAVSMEDKERVEVLNGLSGFLFGAASPGGMVNYVNKRPTKDRLNSITVGNYGGSQNYIHGDFGGSFDADGKIGYRVNLVRQDGETAVDDQKIDRTLASVALDFNITNRFKVELGGSYSDYKMQAPTAYWFFEEGVPRIKAPDSSKNWSQPWIRDEMETRKLMAKATFEANEHLTLRVAYIREDQDRPKQDHTMNSVSSPTGYSQIRIHSGYSKTESESKQALADLSFATGSISHKVTLGYFGYTDSQWQTSYSPNTGWQGPYGFGTPTHVAQPVWPAVPPNSMYYASRTTNDNFMIGDLVKFNDQWSALVGVNRSTIKTIGREPDGSTNVEQPDYKRSRNSPSASLIFKPVPWLTTYATYIEGLEQGGTAPLTATNQLAIMPPMQSKQKEIGVKAELGGVLLSGALFDIEKANEFTDASGTYRQDGKQRNRGAEVSAFGKLTNAWSVVGGVTMLTAKVEGGEFDGGAPANVPKMLAKLYSEYALPWVTGLSVSGGVYHVGKQWSSETNTSRLPAYTTVDLGMRYVTQVSGRPLTLRLNVNNVADRDYWLNSYYLGTPRSVAFSAQMPF
ncbi:TonB-dependent siderophore receptor [Herminiimonas glaciei]|uniref:TonB-dependent siderophore receptor n=1 Tax=Herminiimonas glaciei TaxID=523788 RepID=A0ABW2IB63_9BURK